MVMGSCTSDHEDDRDNPVSGNLLTVLPVSSSFVDVQPMTRSGYLPDGYIWYNELSSATSPAYANIGIFMTPERMNPSRDYIYLESGNTW